MNERTPENCYWYAPYWCDPPICQSCASFISKEEKEKEKEQQSEIDFGTISWT